MDQLFGRNSNLVARASIVGGVIVVTVGVWLAAVWYRSSYSTGEGIPVEQTVPFSHAHHVSALGIDCRYCHTAVEVSAEAGMPSTDTCMNCHWQIWTDAEILEPVRASWRTGTRLRWNRVYRLPDYVYFDHSVHVAAGFGCATCHGRIDRMPLTAKAEPMTMKWCLACHRDPARSIRPADEVFDMTWQPPDDQTTRGARLVAERGIETGGLTECSTCHR